jgi:hypothetical protein
MTSSFLPVVRVLFSRLDAFRELYEGKRQMVSGDWAFLPEIDGVYRGALPVPVLRRAATGQSPVALRMPGRTYSSAVKHRRSSPWSCEGIATGERRACRGAN